MKTWFVSEGAQHLILFILVVCCSTGLAYMESMNLKGPKRSRLNTMEFPLVNNNAPYGLAPSMRVGRRSGEIWSPKSGTEDRRFFENIVPFIRNGRSDYGLPKMSAERLRRDVRNEQTPCIYIILNKNNGSSAITRRLDPRFFEGFEDNFISDGVLLA